MIAYINLIIFSVPKKAKTDFLVILVILQSKTNLNIVNI